MKQIDSINFTGKNIAIIGAPTSGKTHLANYLKLNKCKNHKIIHTDSYLKHEIDELINYYLIRDINSFSMSENYIIEGMRVYNLLNNNSLNPDYIILLNITEKQMINNYAKERDNINIRSIIGFSRKTKAIFNNYMKTSFIKFIKINNNKRII